MKDFSKEPIRIGHVILWRKGWYEWKCKDFHNEKEVLKDIREMLKYDGYQTEFMSDDEIYQIIFRVYDEYFIWAFQNEVPGFYEAVSSIVTGTYHNIYKTNNFRFNMLLEILAKFAWVDPKYLKLPCPYYDKKHYKIGTYKNGMTYKYMNKVAKQQFNK